MESMNKLIKRGNVTKGYKTMYFDVMLNGTFMFQLAYKYCPIFKIDLNDVLREVFERRPSLRNKRIEVCETKAVLF